MTTSAPVRRKGMTRKQKRLAIIAGLAAVVALAATLVLTAMRDQIVFFYTPTEAIAREVPVGKAIRLGGLVKPESWVRDGQTNTFVVTDGRREITATFIGILPDLFREGQDVVAEGSLLNDSEFKATNVLAKHDENYVPREITKGLDAASAMEPEASVN